MLKNSDGLFISAVILAYLPSSYIDIILIPVLIFFSIVWSISRKGIIGHKLFIYLSFYIICSVFSIIISNLNYEVNYVSFLFKFFSFFVFLVPFIIKPNNNELIHKSNISFLIKLSILQSLIGIAQFLEAIFTGRTNPGDVVEGTLSIAFGSSAGLTHQSFVIIHITIISYILLMGKNYKKRERSFAIVLGIITIGISSVFHMIMFLVAASLITYLWYSLKDNKINLYKIIFSKGLGIVCLLFTLLFMLPGFKGYFEHYYNVITIHQAKYAKAQLMTSFVNDIGNSPHILISGYGPGQFNSRAAQLVTGEYVESEYFNSSVRYIDADLPRPFQKHVEKIFKFQRSEHYYWGSTGSPSSSLLGMLFEHGVIFIILWLFLIKEFVKNSSEPISLFLLVFTTLISFQENYIELTSQVLPLFLIIGRTRLINLKNS